MAGPGRIERIVDRIVLPALMAVLLAASFLSVYSAIIRAID
jgi:hypothetical protein